MELFEIIRRDVFVHGKSRWAVARELHVHRRTVRQALESAVPPARKLPERVRPALTNEMRRQVDVWLVAERPNKYSAKVRDRAVRLVFEAEGSHPSQWAAIGSIAEKIGCTSATLPGQG